MLVLALRAAVFGARAWGPCGVLASPQALFLSPAPAHGMPRPCLSIFWASALALVTCCVPLLPPSSGADTWGGDGSA